MVDATVEKVVKHYLQTARQHGIQTVRGVLYGSRARGTATDGSDIDLVVIAPEFDRTPDRSLVEKLWELRAQTDSRIEPIPCGEVEWQNPTTARVIIEIAHREGIEIAAQ